MAEQIGAQIKEARLAAGFTQKALAEAIDGLSAKRISEAERGLRELTDEQLAAIAEVTGAESLLGEVKEEAPEVSVEEPEPEAEPETEPEPEAETEPEGQQNRSAAAGLAGILGGITGGANPLASLLGGVEGLDLQTVGAIAGALGSVSRSTTDSENPPAEKLNGEGLDLNTVGTIASVLGKISG